MNLGYHHHSSHCKYTELVTTNELSGVGGRCKSILIPQLTEETYILSVLQMTGPEDSVQKKLKKLYRRELRGTSGVVCLIGL